MSENLNIIVASKPQVVSEEGNEGLYEISGLYPGYGSTLGNALRRMLLSSIPGNAITSIRIKGVPHEFSTISGIKEDVLNMVINMKNIKIKAHTEQYPQTITLKKKGKGKITAGDFETPSQVEIANKDLVIAEITDDKTSIEVEADVSSGIGFRPREDIVDAPVGSIVIDAVFSPVKRSSYEVHNMRVGNRTDFNSLKIFVETDGTITPRNALDTAIKTMIIQLEAMVSFQKDDDKKMKKMEKEVAEEVNSIKIEDLGLSATIVSNLERAGVKNVMDLLKKGITDTKDIQGIGEKAFSEISASLEERGLILKDDK